MSDEALRDAGTGDRLVMTFHGPGAGPEQFHGAAAALLPGAHVVSPAGDAEGRFYRDEETGEDLADSAGRMAAFVAAEIERVGAQSAVGIGYAGGANILAAVAMQAPDLFDTLALLHPRVPHLPDPEPRLAETRVLITGGQADPVAPPALTQSLAGWFSAQMADVTVAWHPGADEIPQSEVEALRDFLT